MAWLFLRSLLELFFQVISIFHLWNSSDSSFELRAFEIHYRGRKFLLPIKGEKLFFQRDYRACSFQKENSSLDCVGDLPAFYQRSILRRGIVRRQTCAFHSPHRENFLIKSQHDSHAGSSRCRTRIRCSEPRKFPRHFFQGDTSKTKKKKEENQ